MKRTYLFFVILISIALFNKCSSIDGLTDVWELTYYKDEESKDCKYPMKETFVLENGKEISINMHSYCKITDTKLYSINIAETDATDEELKEIGLLNKTSGCWVGIEISDKITFADNDDLYYDYKVDGDKLSLIGKAEYRFKKSDKKFDQKFDSCSGENYYEGENNGGENVTNNAVSNDYCPTYIAKLSNIFDASINKELSVSPISSSSNVKITLEANKTYYLKTLSLPNGHYFSKTKCTSTKSLKYHNFFLYNDTLFEFTPTITDDYYIPYSNYKNGKLQMTVLDSPPPINISNITVNSFVENDFIKENFYFYKAEVTAGKKYYLYGTNFNTYDPVISACNNEFYTIYTKDIFRSENFTIYDKLYSFIPEKTGTCYIKLYFPNSSLFPDSKFKLNLSDSYPNEPVILTLGSHIDTSAKKTIAKVNLISGTTYYFTPKADKYFDGYYTYNLESESDSDFLRVNYDRLRGIQFKSITPTTSGDYYFKFIFNSEEFGRKIYLCNSLPEIVYTSIAINSIMNNQFTSQKQTVLYKISLQAGTQYYFYSTGSVYPSLYIYDISTESEVSIVNCTNSGINFSNPFKPTTTQDYYLIIKNDDKMGLYSIYFDKDDHAANIASATSINVGDTTSGKISHYSSSVSNRDLDTFKINLNSGTTYEFYSEGNIDIIGELRNSAGENCNSDDDSGTDNNFRFTYPCLSSGFYYITVYPKTSEAIGNYTLKVNQVP